MQDLGQNVLVERQVGDHALELGVLLAQLPQLPQLRRPEMAILLLPDVIGRLGDPQLAANIRHRGAALRLSQRIGDLLVRIPRALHRPRLLPAPQPALGGLPEATLVPL